MLPLLLSIDQVAEALQVSRRTAYALRSRDGFPKPVTLANRCVRYRASDVATFVERLASDAPEPEPERLKAGKARRRGSDGGLSGGTATPDPAKPRQSPTPAERSSVEPEKVAA